MFTAGCLRGKGRRQRSVGEIVRHVQWISTFSLVHVNEYPAKRSNSFGFSLSATSNKPRVLQSQFETCAVVPVMAIVPLCSTSACSWSGARGILGSSRYAFVVSALAHVCALPPRPKIRKASDGCWCPTTLGVAFNTAVVRIFNVPSSPPD